jgi:hypothetical protein
LASAFASICRTRSRVTEKCPPISSSVWSEGVSMPKRRQRTTELPGIERGERQASGVRHPAGTHGRHRIDRALVLGRLAEGSIVLFADRRLGRHTEITDGCGAASGDP